jgi:hypothetical protein
VLDGTDQPIDMHVEVATRLHIGGIAIGEVPDALGELRRVGHLRLVEQHR